MSIAIPQATSDERPWGRFTCYAMNQYCTVKVIEVAPGGILSLQRHSQRAELWIALDAGLIFEIGNDVIAAEVGQQYEVPRNILHRIRSERGGRLLEVAFGTFDEGDIERVADAYGRT